MEQTHDAFDRCSIQSSAAKVGRGVQLRSEAEVTLRGQTTSDVAIVGGGIAGLCAAKHLTDAGVLVTLLEARPRVGGRLWTMPGLGAPYDAGGQFFHPSYTESLALAAHYGFEALPCAMHGAPVGSFGGRRMVIDDPTNMPFSDPRAVLQLMTAHARFYEMASTLPADAPWAAPDAERWDAMTFRDWVKGEIQDADAQLVFVTQVSFDMMLGWDNVSLLAVLAAIRSVGADKALGTVLQLSMGAGGLVEAIGRELGDRVRLNSPVYAIRQTESALTLETASGRVAARTSIVAMSPSLADRIEMNPPLGAKRKVLQRLWVDGPNVKTVLVYDRPWWRDSGLSGYAIGDRVGAAMVAECCRPDRPEGVLAAFSQAIANMPIAVQDDPGARRDLVLDDLAHYFGAPARVPVRMAEMNWYAEHWTAGAGSAPPPGLLTRFGVALRPAHDRVIWSGTETAEEFTGGIEGAVRSGQRAATEALARLN